MSGSGLSLRSGSGLGSGIGVRVEVVCRSKSGLKSGVGVGFRFKNWILNRLLVSRVVVVSDRGQVSSRELVSDRIL